MRFDVWGARGGHSGGNGGFGARITGNLLLPTRSTATTLTLVVGDAGQDRGGVYDSNRGAGTGKGGPGGLRGTKADGGGGGSAGENGGSPGAVDHPSITSAGGYGANTGEGGAGANHPGG